jgi:hypothetical protein
MIAFVGLVLAAAAQKLAASAGEPAPDLIMRTDRGPLERIPCMGRPERDAAQAPRPGADEGPMTGYRNPRTGQMVPGHLLALTFFVLTLLTYGAGYFAFRPGAMLIPSLGYLMLILLLAAWGLPGVSFALDRYRVPVLLLLILVSFLANTAARGDHFYRVVSSSGDSGIEGNEVIGPARSSRPPTGPREPTSRWCWWRRAEAASPPRCGPPRC